MNILKFLLRTLKDRKVYAGLSALALIVGKPKVSDKIAQVGLVVDAVVSGPEQAEPSA